MTLSFLLNAALSLKVGIGLVRVQDLVSCFSAPVPMLELELICTEHHMPVCAAFT